MDLSAPYSEIYYGQFCGQSEDILPALDVYQRAEVQILGKPFTFCIIGASHFIYSKKLDYSEIFACAPLSLANLNVLDVRKLDSQELATFVLPKLQATTQISIERIVDDLSTEGSLLLEHTFGPKALTQLSVLKTGWETLHTYPEYGTVVRTKTKLEILENQPNT